MQPSRPRVGAYALHSIFESRRSPQVEHNNVHQMIVQLDGRNGKRRVSPKDYCRDAHSTLR